MSFDDLLTHVVTIVRRFDLGTDDDYGQPDTEEQVIATVRADIQPKSEREQALVSQAGAATSDHLIFVRPTDVTTADVIVHTPATCGIPNDLPAGRYELVGTPYAAGRGHHLELDAHLVSTPDLVAAGS